MNRWIVLILGLGTLFYSFGVPDAMAVGGDEIPPLTLHAFAETDPLLAARYFDIDGFYSVRPPAGWKRVSAAPRGGEKDPWRWRVLFRGPKAGDALEAGVGFDGPYSLDKESLSRFMGQFTAFLRRRPGLRVDESGLFLYDRYTCIRVKGREKGKSLTWFLVFGPEPKGEHLRLVLSSYPGHPVKYGKVLDACLASIHWPDLNHGGR